MVRPEWHIRYQKRRPTAPRHSLDVMQHLIQREAGSRIIPERDLGEAVPNKRNINVGALAADARGIIVCCQNSDGLALCFKRIELLDRCFFADWRIRLDKML